MTYNMSFIDTANNLYDVAVGSNTLTNGAIGLTITFVVFIFVFVISDQENKTNAFISASFSSAIIGSFLWFVDLFPYEYLIIPVILLAFGIGKKFFNKE